MYNSQDNLEESLVVTVSSEKTSYMVSANTLLWRPESRQRAIWPPLLCISEDLDLVKKGCRLRIVL